ncbi:MAG: hypothetical protein JWM57_576, partial [Phycisphaerales bacterium]|nr:hypothetical protein [Phycisphaerales bacterium]
NRKLATNLFGWLTDVQSPAVVSSSFTTGSPSRLTFRLDDNLNGTLAREDIRLRNRRTGVAIASRDWSLGIVNGDNFTDGTIKIAGRVTPGPYQLQIDRRQFADDSGNVRTGAIRYAFTIGSASSRRAVTASATFDDTAASFENGFSWLGLWND